MKSIHRHVSLAIRERIFQFFLGNAADLLRGRGRFIWLGGRGDR